MSARRTPCRAGKRTPSVIEAQAERLRAKRAYDRAPTGSKNRRLVELQNATRDALKAEAAADRSRKKR